MKIELGKVYSCGKPMFRKVISVNDTRLKYAKCCELKGGIYVIGGERFFLNTVLISTFERWAKSEVLRNAIDSTEIAQAEGGIFID